MRPGLEAPLLHHLTRVELTLVIGRYAQAWHLEGSGSVTEAVRAWRGCWPTALPLPHPSGRNGAWLKRNPWFEAEVIPALRARVAELLSDASGPRERSDRATSRKPVRPGDPPPPPPASG